MEAMDFTNCKESGRYYGGSEKKIGIIINNKLEFPQNYPHSLDLYHPVIHNFQKLQQK